jgi:ABC-type glycerol-3-phosphate transport system permease component
MRRGPAAVTINVALALAAAFAVLPLLWMVSVSFMQPGAASSYPPPLLPADPTLDNYRLLFASAGMGGYLLNSAVIACASLRARCCSTRWPDTPLPSCSSPVSNASSRR